MPPDNASHNPSLDALIEAAYQQTLARFEKDVRRGERRPGEELAAYRRRRRDCLSLLRLDQPADEARELAARLLQTHDVNIDSAQRAHFERDVTRLLVRLYDAFIARAERDI